MPRLMVEYSPNLQSLFDPSALLDQLTEAAAAIPSINSELLKVRLFAPQVGWLGLEASREDQGYLFVLFEWLEGRNQEKKEALLAALKKPLIELKARLSNQVALSITLEIREIRHEDHHAL